MSAWDAALIALKTITYGGTLSAAGAVWFLRYCDALVTRTDRRRIRLVVLASAGLALAAGAAQIPAAAGLMSGAPGGMWDASLVRMVWQTGATANLIRIAGLVLVTFSVLQSRPSWPALLGAVVAATSFAWNGHARSAGPATLPLLLGIHLVGVAFWLGALGPLLIVASGADTARIGAAAARFGTAALYVVAALVSAAAILLWRLLGGVAQLWASAYGRYAMLKLVFVAGLLCLAALNNRRLTPRLAAGDDGALRGLRVSVRLELMLGIVILAVTAVLTTIASPPALD